MIGEIKIFLIGLIMGAVLLGMVLLMQHCNNRNGNGLTTDTTYITRIIAGDSAPTLLSSKIPMPAYVDSSVYMHFDPIDTPAIIAEYMRGKYYIDTIYREGNVLAIIKDSVNYNSIRWRNFELQNLRATAIYTTQITHSQSHNPYISLGGVGIFDSQRLYIGPSLMLTDKNRNHYTVGIHYAYQRPVAISIGYYKQVNIRK